MRTNRILFLFVIIAILAFAGCGGGASPKATVDAFIAAGKAGDKAKMVALCTGDMLKFWQKMEEMGPEGDDMDLAKEFKDVPDVKVEEKSVEGDTAKVDVTVEEDVMTFVLTKTGAAWLISDMIVEGMSIGDMLKQLEEMEKMLENLPDDFEMPDMPEMPKGDTGE